MEENEPEEEQILVEIEDHFAEGHFAALTNYSLIVRPFVCPLILPLITYFTSIVYN